MVQVLIKTKCYYPLSLQHSLRSLSDKRAPQTKYLAFQNILEDQASEGSPQEDLHVDKKSWDKVDIPVVLM